jgi:hypothetical protein
MRDFQSLVKQTSALLLQSGLVFAMDPSGIFSEEDKDLWSWERP